MAEEKYVPVCSPEGESEPPVLMALCSRKLQGRSGKLWCAEVLEELCPWAIAIQMATVADGRLRDDDCPKIAELSP